MVRHAINMHVFLCLVILDTLLKIHMLYVIHMLNVVKFMHVIYLMCTCKMRHVCSCVRKGEGK